MIQRLLSFWKCHDNLCQNTPYCHNEESSESSLVKFSVKQIERLYFCNYCHYKRENWLMLHYIHLISGFFFCMWQNLQRKLDHRENYRIYGTYSEGFKKLFEVFCWILQHQTNLSFWRKKKSVIQDCLYELLFWEKQLIPYVFTCPPFPGLKKFQKHSRNLVEKL